MSRIVVVERDRLMQRLLVEWLETEGYDVRAFSSCNEVTGTVPDLVIADIYMPRQDGCAKLGGVRGTWPGTPLIAISAQFRGDLPAPSATARELGAVRVIAKPFTRQILLSAVRELTR
jgi:DNA-binding response OmpR family regulator